MNLKNRIEALEIQMVVLTNLVINRSKSDILLVSSPIKGSNKRYSN